MLRRTLLALVTFTVAVALTGCLREDGTYTLNEDSTVDGTIVLAKDEEYVDAADPTSGLDPAGVAAGFVHVTVTDLGEPGWVGDRITFVGEPIATFATATDAWEIAVSRVGTQYVVTGAAIDPAQDSMRQTIVDEGGSMNLRVTFPGPVEEHNGSLSGTTVTWNMLTQPIAPYARGSAVPPAPDPVVTVVISPAPVVTPSASPSATASPSASPAALADSSGADGTAIPVWIWIIGAVLLATVAGLGSYLLATRRAAAPTVAYAPDPEPEAAPDSEPEPAPEPDPDPLVAPTKPTPKVVPTKPTPTAKPKLGPKAMPPA